MSKAFTKDDAWQEPVVAPRAPLPAGVPNYVTPRGLRLLREELARLEADARRDDARPIDDDEEHRRLAVAGQRMSELAARIASARLVDPAHAHDTVRFGATVALCTIEGKRAGEQRRLQIVGVDEADPAHGRIAFTAPLARAILGCAPGDVATLETADGEQVLQIVAVDYLPEP